MLVHTEEKLYMLTATAEVFYAIVWQGQMIVFVMCL